MARRGGKAASRQARQRRRERAGHGGGATSRQAPPPAPLTEAPSPGQPAGAPIGSPAGSLSSATRTSGSGVRRAIRGDPRIALAGPSRLSTHDAAEYHYVVRDLRNIGVLSALLAILLGVAFAAFNVLHLVRP